MTGTEKGGERSVINSRIENLRNLSPAERLGRVGDVVSLTDAERRVFVGGGLPIALADGMIENVIGTFELPIGVATNFTINGRDYLIPMAVEEPSVVAAASYMARLARKSGGFFTSSTGPIMRAQVQVLEVRDPHGARARILREREAIIAAANLKDKVLISLGGGCRDVEVHVFDQTNAGPMVVVHLIVDVRDAMGANTVNTMAEAVAPMIEAISGGVVRLRILSNFADLRIARAMVTVAPETLQTDEYKGDRIARGIVEACALAIVDPYRAATHNKGIMNGIDPIVVATGNDWRAIEAGAHVWASRSGRYTALSTWELDAKGHLVGTLEMPMALGLVGGATKTHPAARAALRILGVESAQELAEVAVAVGLSQNMGALRALATEGIQRGHMALHARNIAIVAGATGDEIDRVASTLSSNHDVRVDRAKDVLELIRAEKV
ncbi:hydroxymethylglutaryl-CoA reductase, degradative [Mesorhizobium sp. M7A.F.Ca.US.011.01.1.1]|uniref:hydroxymethylglutaryl-CoA reductase, degradative n=1 Tax=unclassified Mesorhizobium TaxID=325217 RepID=UPI000FCC2759|nr:MULTISPECIES: hydroxymethylglutaryl-CoA reductase, degradative [unclassified Mesorhizobium]RUW90269.1 hydroxymethylglutaryl-CoA reductase, degradative [Mesorhizobium sp. M7A.F.Ca.US.010.02.1.1]RUX25389.1 hydroxymethylglutaryl-CoA reductase, degradative [Mesorhizobium sp. M7A.F.Ca.US.011.01.1.1]